MRPAAEIKAILGRRSRHSSPPVVASKSATEYCVRWLDGAEEWLTGEVIGKDSAIGAQLVAAFEERERATARIVQFLVESPAEIGLVDPADMVAVSAIAKKIRLSRSGNPNLSQQKICKLVAKTLQRWQAPSELERQARWEERMRVKASPQLHTARAADHRRRSVGASPEPPGAATTVAHRALLVRSPLREVEGSLYASRLASDFLLDAPTLWDLDSLASSAFPSQLERSEANEDESSDEDKAAASSLCGTLMERWKLDSAPRRGNSRARPQNGLATHDAQFRQSVTSRHGDKTAPLYSQRVHSPGSRPHGSKTGRTPTRRRASKDTAGKVEGKTSEASAELRKNLEALLHAAPPPDSTETLSETIDPHPSCTHLLAQPTTNNQQNHARLESGGDICLHQTAWLAPAHSRAAQAVSGPIAQQRARGQDNEFPTSAQVAHGRRLLCQFSGVCAAECWDRWARRGTRHAVRGGAADDVHRLERAGLDSGFSCVAEAAEKTAV
eukprot:SAG11_NODE_3214_length_2606_cov_2.788193_2_plen_500_part_00